MSVRRSGSLGWIRAGTAGSRRSAPAASTLANLVICGVVLSAVLLGLAGCTATSPPTQQVRSPFDPCPSAAATPPAGAGDSSAGSDAALPAVTLPCFSGGEPVVLARLGRPTIVNFWASYCQPCRTELPELQRFADATAGRLVVVGVVTRDSRPAAASAGVDFGVTFPSVEDRSSELLSTLGRNALPVTLFIDAHGRIRHQDVSGALTYERLSELATQYLGISV